jgi:NAD(P)-dependent dehydrogenase (short-subunit alcohol dehydrogenase family)
VFAAIPKMVRARMQELNNKIAFVTGGASGLGLAMTKAFLRQGMKVMIADIEEGALVRAAGELGAPEGVLATVVCDVARRTSVEAAAATTLEKFGKVHIVCNNAGVAVSGAIGTIPHADWDWVIDVNFKGVVYGVETFVSLIERHGEGGHIVNTASLAGFGSFPTAEPYAATKYAVVGMSEGWAAQLAPRDIGVSILCPAYVRTRIAEARRNRPERFGGEERMTPEEAASDPGVQMVMTGIPAEPVGERVVEAIKANELYIFTHPEYKPLIEARFNNVLAAFDKAAESPALAVLPKRTLGAGQ